MTNKTIFGNTFFSFTKKGPGRVASKSGRSYHSKLADKQIKHTVGLKNAVVSIVQAHFDEKSKKCFFGK